MIARISTHFACTESELWQQITKPESLQYVAWPILTFSPIEPGAFDSEWELGRDYPLKLYFLKFIPLGRHTIQLVKIDTEENIIWSRERGLLAPVWNHKISFQETKPGLVSYSDEVEIRAGFLTLLIWVFAHGFYRYRQQRWKRLLKNSSN
ncbi:hypothetical protein SAMN05216203_2021 [Marinobacter daqiaonensis]|uniref:Ligand-binding SRPBCC domain-containing protein n=1 Tax=Marinobacter daqiaonensis TaxID=650891 RepID=A0A1I6IAC7_9GAMM|nr:hypothetical protein SAMN05216203_2021 [Marinobacter daqiaonensis]